MSKLNKLDSFEKQFLFSLKEVENVKIELEQEMKIIQQLQKDIEYLLNIYSKIKVNNVRVKDGLISPIDYLTSLTKIIKSQSSDTRFGKLLDEFVSNVSQLDRYLLINMVLFRYGLKRRSLMPGAIPLGFIEDSWKVHPKFVFGTIDYNAALSEQQVMDYELTALFVEKATIKWCSPEMKKALEIAVELPSNEIDYQEGIILVSKMKAAQHKLPSSLQKHWESMIARVISAFGTEFEQLL